MCKLLIWTAKLKLALYYTNKDLEKNIFRSSYGGPASKAISNSFKFDWGLYLSTNQSVVYAFIDGRNTMKRGEKMLFAGYRALGTVEIEDQINVTR